MIETEERRMVHGMVLLETIALAVPQTVGICGCGACVELPFTDDSDEAECAGCGRRWRLSVIVQVERA